MGEKGTNKGKKIQCNKKTSSSDLLSAMNNSDNDLRSLSKEIKKLAKYMRNPDTSADLRTLNFTEEFLGKSVPCEENMNGFAAIDKFLDSEGENREISIDKIIESESQGYYFSSAEYEESERDNELCEQITSINSFLSAVKSGEFRSQEPKSDMDIDTSMTEESSNQPPIEETFFTESLANIYIRQRKYDRALGIIKKLSLNYPEKNIYFADQIRFLEKLIFNIKL